MEPAVRRLREAAQDAGAGLPSVALMEFNPAGEILAVNEAYCDLVGRRRDSVVGTLVQEMTDPRDHRRALAAWRRLGVTPGARATYEKRYVRPDGSSYWVRISAVNCGQDRILGHVTDIDELVQSRQAAEAARRRLETLVERSADIIAVIDAEGRLLDANPSAARLLGRDPKLDLGRSMLELVHPEDLSRALQALAESVSSGGVQDEVVLRLQAADHSWTHLALTANNCLDDPAIGGIVVNARDVGDTVRNMRGLVGALIRATEYRDPYTAGHQGKVSRLAARIARYLELPADDISYIQLGAELHDLGKIAVPSEILTRPGRLSPAEMEIVKGHCRVGHDILKDANLAAPITDVVLHHHERLDGSGYPDGLSGAELQIWPRIVAVADVIDAIASHRPYRAGQGIPAAIEEITAQRGTKYDRDVVAAAVAVLAEAPGSEGHALPA
jgi:PAS domain S-box-containing protein